MDLICRVNAWSRSNLAGFYHTQEVQLVKCAALSGNGYICHFEPEQLGIGEDSSSLEELLTISQQDEDPFDLASIVDRNAKMAVVYSIALYELEDILPLFHLEEYKTHNQLELMDDLATDLVLTAKQRVLKTWIPTSQDVVTNQRSQ